MQLRLAILGGGSNAQTLLQGRRADGSDVKVDRKPFVIEEYEPGADEKQDIMKELVRIEKKHWTKAQSWGEQLPTLVAKRNAYVFVLLARGQGREDDVSPIGYAIVYVNALHAQLSKVFTMPAWRGRGVAGQLVGIVMEAVERLKNTSEFEVTLFVETENRAALAVYTRCGFEREARVMKDYYTIGSDAYRMVRKLR